jgi:protein-S-isoprenylcysteine O-methyltransferase Ste14
MFLLGMGTNLIGEPDSTFGKVANGIILGLHILIAIGLVAVSIRLLLAARKAGLGERLALWGLVVVIVTFLAGVLTMITGNDWWSYLMSVGFLVAVALYGGTFIASYRAGLGAGAPQA